MKVMVCYDGSKAAKAALKLALRNARAFDARICLVTAVEGDVNEQAQALTRAEQDLASASVYLKVDGIVCDTQLLPSRNLSAGESLVQYARAHEFDEIVIGVVRKSKVGKLLFGSTAQFVILNAACPVLTVRNG